MHIYHLREHLHIFFTWELVYAFCVSNTEIITECNVQELHFVRFLFLSGVTSTLHFKWSLALFLSDWVRKQGINNAAWVLPCLHFNSHAGGLTPGL